MVSSTPKTFKKSTVDRSTARNFTVNPFFLIIFLNILGRNFDYSRALEIIQEEDYLDDVDFDDIRIIRRRNLIMKETSTFRIRDNWRKRPKRQAIFCNSMDSGPTGPSSPPNPPSPPSPPGPPGPTGPTRPTGPTGPTGGSKRQSPIGPCLIDPDDIPEPRVTVAVVGTIGLVMMLMFPPAQPLAPGVAPNTSPLPGTPGGGDLPTAFSNPNLGRHVKYGPFMAFS